MRIISTLLSPFAWLIKQFLLLKIWYSNRLVQKNNTWRQTMAPGEGCFVFDKMGNKIRVQIVNIRAGSRGDVTVKYWTKQGLEVHEHYRKTSVFKY